MPCPDNTLSGRSQSVTPGTEETITLNRKGIKKLATMLDKCLTNTEGVRQCDVMLYSLEHYLSQEEELDPERALLLLRYWLDVAPDLLESISDNLSAASKMMEIILDNANKTT